MSKKKEKQMIRVSEAFTLNHLLNSIKSLAGVSSEGKRLLISSKREINEIVQNYQTDLAELMKLMGVESNNGSYNWDDKDNKDEIVKSVNDLINNEVKADWRNKMSREDIDILMDSLEEINNIIFFEDMFLVKESA